MLCYNELYQRIKFIITKQCGDVEGRGVDRIDDSNARACYLCDAVDGQHGVFMPESLHHMLISCPHVGLVALRVKFKADLGTLCAAEDGLRKIILCLF